MKAAIALLILALGFLWYRGDLKEPLHEIELLVNPQVSRQEPGIVPKDYFKAVQREVGQATKKNLVKEDQNDLGKKVDANSAKGKPVSLDVFTKEKSSSVAQAKWLEGNRVDVGGEPLLIDKFHKLASEGKLE